MATQKRLIRKAVRLLGTQERLANAAGCSQQMIHKLLHGYARVSVEMARKIHLATGGEVDEAELRPDFFLIGRDTA